jgi:hypothetical protein
MAISKTPKTTATININSNNMTSSPINLSCTWTMYKDGSKTAGLDITSGLNRVNTGTTNAVTIGDESEFDNNEAHMVYIKNLAITCGSVLGRVQPGAACLFPWAGNADLTVTQAAADMEWEYQLFMQKED